MWPFKKKDAPVFMAKNDRELVSCGPPPPGKAYIYTEKGWVMVDANSKAAKNSWNCMT